MVSEIISTLYRKYVAGITSEFPCLLHISLVRRTCNVLNKFLDGNLNEHIHLTTMRSLLVIFDSNEHETMTIEIVFLYFHFRHA